MADKHSGCFVCGGGQGEILKSTPDMRTMESVALCSQCYALPNDSLAAKITKIREAMEQARRAAAHG